MSETPTVFKNRRQAFLHLRELGYKVSNGKFYKHADPPPKGEGLVRLNEDGSIALADLLAYAQKHLVLNPAEAKAADRSAGSSSKLVDAKLEGQRLQNEAKRVKIMRDLGQLIPLDDHKQELVRTVVLIKNQLFEMCGKVAPALVQTAGQPNGAALVEDALVQQVSKVFNDLAKPSTWYEVLDSDVQALIDQLEGADNAETA